jgi:hypothetical protein
MLSGLDTPLSPHSPPVAAVVMCELAAAENVIYQQRPHEGPARHSGTAAPHLKRPHLERAELAKARMMRLVEQPRPRNLDPGRKHKR